MSVLPTLLDTLNEMSHFVAGHGTLADVLHDALIFHNGMETIDIGLAVGNKPQARCF